MRKAYIFILFLLLSCSKDNSIPDTVVTTLEPTITKFTLAVADSEGGSVDISGGTYNENSNVSITASPADGYTFSRWSGDVSATGNPLSINMNSNKAITANFLRKGIYFENNTCKCPGATLGDTTVINGVTYTVVDNSTIAGQILNGNVNLCTTVVTNMSNIFKDKNFFNTDIGFWNTSNVTDMTGLFSGATSFNQDIGNWDTSSVIRMKSMLEGTTEFNQDLTGWCVTNITSKPTSFSKKSNLTEANKPVWGTCPSD